jgi:uncharacterized protein
MATRKTRAAAAPYPPHEPTAPPQVAEPSARYLGIDKVLADSGPLLALFNRADHWHAPVLHWLRTHSSAKLISTWPVATEVCALLARRVHNDAALDFLRWAQRGGLVFDKPEDSSLAEVLHIIERFADLPFDLADASIAEAAARLKVKHVLSIDADFDVYRGRDGKALVNVLHG